MTDPAMSLSGPGQTAYVGEKPSKGGFPSYDDLPPSLPLTYCGDGIRHRALTRLQGAFHSYGHKPSPDQWKALSAIAGTMEAMADGTCLPHYYLSSLDPGIGKTQTLIQTIKEVVTAKEYDLAPKYPNVGIVVFLSRLDEIKNLVGEGGFSPCSFSVLTSDMELNKAGLGSDRVNDAQILFTTQQRLENATLRGSKFADCSAFFYRGKPRQVRVWDESLVPGRNIVIERRSILALLELLHKRYPALTADLENICDNLRELSDGELYEVPDFVEKHGISDLTAKGVLRTLWDHRAETIQSLWFLSGRKVGVRREGKTNLFIDHQNFLPDDLAPLLILDASGRVRTTYEFWKNRRKGLEELPTGHKRYDNLTVDVWRQSGSKSGWKTNPRKLVEGIRAMIATDPDRDWLIIHHLPHSVGINLPKELKAHPAVNADRLKFLTWGQHFAVNTFKDIPNVILAGTLFYASSVIESLGMAAAKHPSSDGALSKADKDKIELGEHSHDILQALCRGRVRGCVDGVCPPSKAFVIAHPSSGIPASLETIFPRATVRDWKPPLKSGDVSAVPLKGKAKTAFEFIYARLKVECRPLVTFGEAGKSVNYDKSDFRKIRKNQAFIEALAMAGITESTKPHGFRLSQTPTH
ncbi:hypothetical protein ACFPL7_01000 [Dongia soli]|uniref:Helicase ATP-binding domain-containing protein n=1 Tax=Dongia soli TaxID=600628 RepID=A0ABU5EE28_9PROT|nr:hypothetical protein [Dongia soli]MDY0884314.1 hypothetical protein [Dongia soli]